MSVTISLPIDTSTNLSRKEYMLTMYEIINMQSRTHTQTLLRRVKAICSVIMAHKINPDITSLKNHIFALEPFIRTLDKGRRQDIIEWVKSFCKSYPNIDHEDLFWYLRNEFNITSPIYWVK